MYGLIYHFQDDIHLTSQMQEECWTVYIMTRVTLVVGGECAIEPQKNITGFMVDGWLTIQDPNSDHMPGIWLEIDENVHDRYDGHKEKHRAKVIRSFKHRILRVAVGRKATYAELGVSIQQIVRDFRLMVKG